MKIKTLGRTGINVFTIGIGTGLLGVQNPKDRLEVYRGKPFLADVDLGAETLIVSVKGLVEGAKKQGFRVGQARFVIDTAPFYCDRRSEEAIGRMLDFDPKFRDWVVITTKVGQIFNEFDESCSRIDYGRRAVVSNLATSIQRTGFDFQLVYLHDPMGLSQKEILLARDAIMNFKPEIFVGIAANDPDTTEHLLQTGLFPAAVVPEAVSLINRRIEKGILPAAKKYNIGIAAATVIERGLLTDTPFQDQKLYLGRSFTENCLRHVSKMRKFCEKENLSLGAVAIQWPVQYEQIACSIIGISCLEEAEEFVKNSTKKIPDSFWEKFVSQTKHFEDQRIIWSPQ